MADMLGAAGAVLAEDICPHQCEDRFGLPQCNLNSLLSQGRVYRVAELAHRLRLHESDGSPAAIYPRLRQVLAFRSPASNSRNRLDNDLQALDNPRITLLIQEKAH
jgi:hypothetical protein